MTLDDQQLAVLNEIRAALADDPAVIALAALNQLPEDRVVDLVACIALELGGER